MNNIKIAVIATSYNRKEQTVNALIKLEKTEDYNLTFYLCDDGSTDGTAEEVKKQIPEVNILQGTGDLYWSRGMWVAMKEAVKGNYDFYLMINDDVIFFDDVIDTMMKSYQKAKKSCAIVGATLDSSKTKTTYGGKNIENYQLINPNGSIQKCDLANWNCFLIDKNIIQKIGLINKVYEHASGDYDYSHRMKKKGYDIFVATKYIGVCNRNSIVDTWQDINLSILQRVILLHKKNASPIKSRLYYCFHYEGIKAPYIFIRPYLIIIKTAIQSKISR